MNSLNQKILIVDDIEDNRFTLERRLSRNGYTAISQADCGKKALELVKEESFDLILLDLMMPDISGLDVLKTLKADPKNRGIPVVMVTAADEIETTAECISNGAEDYITKPINATLLKARVTACLEKKRFRDSEEHYLSKVEADKKRTQSFLKQILPEKIAEELNSSGLVRPRKYEDIAILVCDLVGFTAFCESNPPENVVENLQEIFEKFESEIENFGLEKIKTVGDAILATGGLTRSLENQVLSASKCAINLKKIAIESDPNWAIHIGIHSGPLVAGLIGKKSFQFDVLGGNVNTAFNICDRTEPNEILISNEAWMSVRSEVEAQSKGLMKLKSDNQIEVLELLGVNI